MPAEGGAALDGGVTGPIEDDAAVLDAGAVTTPTLEERLVVDASLGEVGDEQRRVCYDGLDNDDDGVFDCAELGCSSLPSCCVAGESLACCDADEPDGLPIAPGCSGSVAFCAGAEMVAFGAPAPTFVDGAFRPLGDAMGDSGAIVVKPLLPTGAIVVRGTLSTPVVSCTAGCFESIGLGLVTDGAPGPLGAVRPWVGVVASAARMQVALVVAGEVVSRLSLEGRSDVEVELVVLPTGAVTLAVHSPGVDRALGTLTARVTPRTEPVQLALYGRGTNVSGSAMTSEARVVSVGSALCPSPYGWLTRDALTTPATAPTAPAAPSVAYGGGQTLLAWEEGGLIQLRVLTVDRLTAGITLPTNGPSVFAADIEYADPDVHADITAGGDLEGYTLYVANRTTGAVDRVALDRAGTPMGPPIPFAVPDDLGLSAADGAALDGPSMLRPAAATSDVPHLFARVRRSSGETRIVRLAMSSDAPDATIVRPVDLESATVRVPQAGFAAFDRDEVAAPSAYRHDGGVQLAFAGRSGARWAIGVMSTDLGDFSRWHTALATPVLAGDASGFDALSVRDPAVVPQRTDIQLFYVGSDGARDVLGLATRSAPDRTLAP